MDGLEDLKDHSNAAFKAGRYEEAVKAYTRALAAARGALHSGAPPTPPALPLQVATLYCNRAAACLKLERYEQAAHDAGRVLRLLLEPGASNARRCTAPWNSALVEKAWVRRGRALLGMGNFAAAMAELKRGARDDQALAAEVLRLARRARGNRRAVLLLCWEVRGARHSPVVGSAMSHPIPYGRDGLPAMPATWVSAALERARSRTLGGVMRPEQCVYCSAVVYNDCIFMFGSMAARAARGALPPLRGGVARRDVCVRRQARGPGPQPSAVGGGDDQRVAPRPDSAARDATLGAPVEPGQPRRANHAAAVWRDSMVVFGGVASGTELGDMWAFDFLRRRWTQLAPEPPARRTGAPAACPEARSDLVGWVHQDHLYIYGGASQELGVVMPGSVPPLPQAHTFDDMWRFDLVAHRWEEVECEGNRPPSLSEAALAVHRNVAYLCGGYSTTLAALSGPGMVSLSAYSSHVFEFSHADAHWRMVRGVDMQGVLGPERAGCCAVCTEGDLAIVGGYIGFHAPQARREVVLVNTRVCAGCGAVEGEGGWHLQLCSRGLLP
eukprot:scaffold7.g3455.t1